MFCCKCDKVEEEEGEKRKRGGRGGGKRETEEEEDVEYKKKRRRKKRKKRRTAKVAQLLPLSCSGKQSTARWKIRTSSFFRIFGIRRSHFNKMEKSREESYSPKVAGFS